MSAIIELKDEEKCPEFLGFTYGHNLSQRADFYVNARSGNLASVVISPKITSIPPLLVMKKELEKIPDVARVYLVSTDRDISKYALYCNLPFIKAEEHFLARRKKK